MFEIEEEAPRNVTAMQRTISIDELYESTAVVDVFYDGRLLVEYDMERMTTKAIAGAKRFMQKGRKQDVFETVEFMADFIAELCTKWNLTGRDGKIIPLDGPSIKERVPAKLLMLIAERIVEHMQPGEASASSSRPPSSGTRRRARRTGTPR